MSEPISGAVPASSNRPTIALVLGILGVVCCGLVAPFAWFMGSAELKAIRGGSAPAAGEGLARAGMILGIIGTVLLLFAMLWIFFAGGMAVLQGMSG